MKNIKKLGFISTMMAVIFVISVATYALTVQTPAEIASEVTGKSIDDVTALKADGKTYGKIAEESGKLDEFKKSILEQKKAILDEKVASGTLAKEKADEVYDKLVEAQENCDGNGGNRIGKENGISFGMGSGGGEGNGHGKNFKNNGNGRGFGMRNGSHIDE